MRLAEDMGAQPIQAALLISYLAIGSTVGRLVFGRLADCQQLSQFYLWQTGLLGISVSSTLVAIVTTYHWLVLYAVTFGLCEGCYITLNPVLIRKLVGTDKFANGLGISYFAMSFTRSVGPPIAGWIFDYFQSYYVAFLYTEFVFMLGNCVAFIAQVVESNSKEKREMHKEEGSQQVPYVKWSKKKQYCSLKAESPCAGFRHKGEYEILAIVFNDCATSLFFV